MVELAFKRQLQISDFQKFARMFLQFDDHSSNYQQKID